MFTGKKNNRKSPSREIVPSSETRGNFHSSLSSGDKLPNAPKPTFSQSQHPILNLPTESQLKTECLAFEDRTAEVPMPLVAVDRTFQLLARWAVRRATENRKVAQESVDNGVIADVSKS